MKKLLYVLFIISSLPVFAQNSDSDQYYLWNKDWKATDKQKEAAYFGRLWSLGDTAWQWDVYKFTGPMISSQRFADNQFKVAQGRQMYYRLNGYLDSSGHALNGLLHGDWYYYNDTGRAITKKVFEKGLLVSTEHLDPNSATQKSDLEKLDEKESEFDGGIKAWQKYLYNNMNYPERAQAAKVMGIVVVQFEVTTTGKVENAEIAKSVEFSIDEESLRLIRQSPKWRPAVQSGRLVRSFKKQPMHFRLK